MPDPVIAFVVQPFSGSLLHFAGAVHKMEVTPTQLIVCILGLLAASFWFSNLSLPVKVQVQRTISGTTGTLFKMNKVREFPKAQLKKSGGSGKWESTGKTCKQWAVTTTIWEPSKTLKQIARLKTWCIVVVLDKKTPLPFEVANAVILGVEDQLELPYRIAKRLPWNHFGRKNVGFMYAVAHGAEVIYDCDDDNELIIEDDESVPPMPQSHPMLSPTPSLRRGPSNIGGGQYGRLRGSGSMGRLR